MFRDKKNIRKIFFLILRYKKLNNQKIAKILKDFAKTIDYVDNTMIFLNINYYFLNENRMFINKINKQYFL